MTHSPTTWLFITLPNGTHVVMDVALDDSDDGGAVLAESPTFDDSGQRAEIGETQ